LVRHCKHWLVALVATGLFFGCTTTGGPAVTAGIQPGFEAFVPSRIAVAPCQSWPQTVRFAALPLTNATTEEQTALCAKVDQNVLAAFQNQPFMRGYSPRAVATLLQEAKSDALMSQMKEHWQHQAGDCHQCPSAASLYQRSVAPRPAWRAWLGTFSAATRRTDAILLPFVTYAAEGRINDRGLLIARRSVGVSLLLVATSDGSLIWSGQRSGMAQNQRLEQADVAAELSYPAWERASEKTLSPDLWAGFPGRQQSPIGEIPKK